MVGKKILNEATKRLVEKFHPHKIILFGSQARGKADKRSDVDLLIICPVNKNRRKLMLKMYRALSEFDFACDIIVLTPNEFEIDRLISGTIARPAWKEGKVLYKRHR